MFTTPTPTPAYATFTTLPFTTLMPEGTCDRAMDLAFLLDGSEALSEDEFQATKEFILGVVERFRMGSAHTRATVLLYHSGVKTYDLQVDKHILDICDTAKKSAQIFGDGLRILWNNNSLVIQISPRNQLLC